MSSQIELTEISLGFDGRAGLEGMTCTFRTGEFTLVTGPNGSGKTLLLKIASELVRPDSGKVRHIPGNVKTALVFQDPLVQILGLTVEEDISFGLETLRLDKASRAQRIQDALAWTGLADKRHQECRTLSGGEKRRLCIASILVLEPEFILLDEPFSNLDYQGVKEVLGILVRLRDEGKGVVVVSHDLDRCLAHADRLMLMKGGRLIADALPERVLPYLEDHGVRRPGGKLADMTWLRST